jgi:hypothetical protein
MDMILRDSKNRYHQVCFQAFSTSCGPASCAMVERIYKHLVQSDEQRALNLFQKYPGGWTIDGGSYSNNLSSILNAEGVNACASTNLGSGGVYSYLKFFPAAGAQFPNYPVSDGTGTLSGWVVITYQ